MESIEFIDANNRTYQINKSQVESFPMIGGNAAQMVTTKAWNQHGNTFVNAMMEAEDSELIFILKTSNLSPFEIEEARREITNICNPLNGIVTMKIVLNSGRTYNRDISFLAAPLFPTGFDNRNRQWQKVMLSIEANNPFWYEDKTITETFQQAIPLFEFPFEMSPEAPIEFGTLIPSKIVENEGQVDAPVMIKIVGACINPIIENVTTGEMIRFKTLTMNDDDVLEIDTTFGQKKVMLNEIDNAFNRLDFSSTFFNLKIGENEIDFRDDTLITPKAVIYFTYRNLYITI